MGKMGKNNFNPLPIKKRKTYSSAFLRKPYQYTSAETGETPHNDAGEAPPRVGG